MNLFVLKGRYTFPTTKSDRADTMKLDTLNLADHVNKSQTLPSYLYTDSEVFEYEKDAIFRKEWLPVARIDQIPDDEAAM